MFQLNHHNIVRMFESFVNEESFYIVMEYCEVSHNKSALFSFSLSGSIQGLWVNILTYLTIYVP